MKFKIREQFWYKLLPYLLVNPAIKISLLRHVASGCVAGAPQESRLRFAAMQEAGSEGLEGDE